LKFIKVFRGAHLLETAKGVKGDKEAFFTEFPLPAIAHVVVDGSLLHYVVIHKITKKQIIIADPGKGIVKYTPEEFFKIWTGVLILLVPTSKFQKGNENKGVLSRFFGLMFPQKRLLLNIFISSLIITVFGILTSFYFRFIMDDIVPNSLRKTLITLSIGVIVLYIFKAVLEAFRNHLMLYLSQKLDIPLILGYYQHVLGLPMNFFGTRKVGEIVSRFMDASKIRDAISSATLSIMIDTLMALVGGIALFSQNHLLFGISVIVVALYGVIVFAFNKPVKKINEKQMEDNSQVTSYLVETLNGIETVKAFHAEDKAQAKTDKLFVKLLKSVFKGGMITNAQQTLTGAISTIGGTVILWVGVVSVLNGNMTLGSLLTFNALLAYFLDPVKNLINLQPTMQTAIVAAERLSEILDLELEKAADENRKLSPQTLNYPIKIENLDFRYGTRKLVLENINMTIGAGEKIALVGESGSGKTTLSKLLMSFYPWEKGEIFIGDYNLKDINLESLRNRIAYISQDIFLFSGTIRENLELGNEDATLEDIIEACKLSKADEFINQMPLRYETMLEENGANLSKGLQLQEHC
jgi:ATP-binding cassette subfamily B protein